MSSNILLLRRLPWTAGHREIIKYFSKYGKVQNVVVNYEKSGFSSGTAIVHFMDSLSVNSAVRDTHFIDNQNILCLKKNNLM